MPRVYPPIEGRQNSSPNISPSLVESVAGFSAGIVSTLAVHPFDVVKTRLQSNGIPQSCKFSWVLTRAVNLTAKSQLGESLRIVRDIVKNEGSTLALYRGLMPNMVGNSVSWALYFLWYASNATHFL